MAKNLKAEDISQILFEKEITFSPNFIACIVDDFLTKEECDKLIEMTESKGYEKALLNIGGGAQKLQTDVRNSDRCIIDDHELAQSLYEKCKKFIPDTFSDGWKKVGLNERLRFLRYDKDDYFKPHVDGSYERPDGREKSFITFFLLLNDGYDGGCSTFLSRYNVKSTYPCKPKAGRLVIFQHNVLHEGSILENGRKYALRTDFMYRK